IVIGRAILQWSQAATEPALVSPNNMRRLLLPFFLFALIWLAGDTRAITAATSTSPTLWLGNISTRSFVQTGDNVMIGGFIVQGTGTKRVIIRAIGPELTQYGITNALANPTLELHNATGALMGSNDNWQTTIIGGIIASNQVSDIQNSGHAPTAANESAIIADLPPGNYTAIVRGVNSTTGVALVEVYDLDPQVPPGIVPVVPKGIFCMSVSGANGFPDQILNDSRIVGLDLGDQWQDIETTEGVYDWSTLDTQLAQAEAHGKKVLLGITSGGLNVPDWLLANYPAMQTFTFIDPNPHHSTYGQPVTMPVFW